VCSVLGLAHLVAQVGCEVGVPQCQVVRPKVFTMFAKVVHAAAEIQADD